MPFDYRLKTAQTDCAKRAYHYLKRHQQYPYQRIPSHKQRQAYQALQQCVGNSAWLVDWGCGRGESTQQLAEQYPNHLCIGIDQSEKRLSQTDAPSDQVHYLRANIIDILLLLKEGDLHQPSHQCLFYPNPYPKTKQQKRRFHYHPIFPTLLDCAPTMQMRTNWHIYAQEWLEAIVFLRPNDQLLHHSIAKNATPISAFERKYLKHGMTCHAVDYCKTP